MLFTKKPSCVGTETCSDWCGQHSDGRAVNASLVSINLFLSLGEENILFSTLCHKDGVNGEEEKEGDVISQTIQLQSFFSPHLFHGMSDNQERCNYLK